MVRPPSRNEISGYLTNQHTHTEILMLRYLLAHVLHAYETLVQQIEQSEPIDQTEEHSWEQHHE